MDLVNSDTEGVKFEVLSLYNSRNYISCLDQILENYNILDMPYYKIMALCCILLSDEFPASSYSKLLVKLKEDKMFAILDAYNFFANDSKYYGSLTIIKSFCSVLISSSNKKCIYYINNALQNVPGLDYYELAAMSYNSSFYYLCDEILTLYCNKMNNDYRLLLLKANVLFRLDNFSECQKYIFLANTLKNSGELCRLSCLCNIIECIDSINGCPDSFKSESIQNALKSLESARNFLV